jgi:FMN-dependent oxidoreductase (nitrilotriacetate monooxygenase family)
MVDTRCDQMNLVVSLATAGFHCGAWRRQNSRADELLGIGFIAELAREAEGAKLDAVLISDSVGNEAGPRRAPRPTELEPLTVLSALAPMTSRIGLIAAMSATYTEPFNLSRYFSSLDHLSDGRAGWNIVISTGGAHNFTVELPPSDERYSRAEEYVRVVTRLWDSWEDDAVIDDRTSGYWVRPDKVHTTDFAGRWYDIEGPAYIPRSPQGWPVLVHGSESEKEATFAARYAEVVFTAQSALAEGKSFYDNMKKAAVAAGRDPDQVRILPRLMPIIGSTEQDARRIANELGDLSDPEVAARCLSAFVAGRSMHELELDEPIPLDVLTSVAVSEGDQGRHRVLYELAALKRQTLRELMRSAALNVGNLVIVGTAEQVADRMQEWFEKRACDGFNLEIPYVPEGMAAMCLELVPMLQERGIFRSEYTSTTLRGHLGLDRPDGFGGWMTDPRRRSGAGGFTSAGGVIASSDPTMQ